MKTIRINEQSLCKVGEEGSESGCHFYFGLQMLSHSKKHSISLKAELS